MGNEAEKTDKRYTLPAGSFCIAQGILDQVVVEGKHDLGGARTTPLHQNVGLDGRKGSILFVPDVKGGKISFGENEPD